MDKMIDKLLRQLKIELAVAALLVVAAAVLGETGVIPNGIVEPKSQEEFYLTVAVIAVAVVCIPLSLTLFSLNTTRNLRRMNMDEALQSYHRWSIVRLAILSLTAVCGIAAYYITLVTSPLFCTLVALAVACYYCYPTRDKVASCIERRSE